MTLVAFGYTVDIEGTPPYCSYFEKKTETHSKLSQEKDLFNVPVFFPPTKHVHVPFVSVHLPPGHGILTKRNLRNIKVVNCVLFYIKKSENVEDF